VTDELLRFGAVTIAVLASGESTGGTLSVFEELPPMVDTPRHVHSNEDELFYVLEGEHVIEVGGEEVEAGPGAAVFAPRRIPHAQRRVVAGEGRLLIVTTPGGFEGFFRQLAAADAGGTLGADAYAAASEKYGISWL